MNTVNVSYARKNFKTVLQSAYNNKTPLTITRPNGNIVILAEDEWNSIQETFHLLSSPKNAQKLQKAIENVENRKNITTFASLTELDNAI